MKCGGSITDMGIYKDYVSNHEMVTLIKTGLVAKGAVSEDAKVTLLFSRHYPTTIIIDDDAVKGNEEEWAEFKRAERRNESNFLWVILGTITVVSVIAVFLAKYLATLAVS